MFSCFAWSTGGLLSASGTENSLSEDVHIKKEVSTYFTFNSMFFFKSKSVQ